MTEDRNITVEQLTWQDITIEVSYEADYLNLGREIAGYHIAHVTITSVDPQRAPLPVTETGYLSHFTRPDEIANAGGAAVFVQNWLDNASTSKEWRRAQDEARQLKLF
jgi:hypothetical protein